MARKTKEEAELTRTRILASALSLFAKQGYDHTTFNDIAARLRLTKGAVYWHFKSKEALLMALIDEMFATFEKQFSAFKSPDGQGIAVSRLTFGAVAELMVHDAEKVVGDRRMSQFFMLMKCQMRWFDNSMAKVRENLLTNERFGPMEAFRCAVENDIREGRARKGVDAVQVATVCLSIWDGLVQGYLEHFLECDLFDTLRKSYEAVWNSIRVGGTPGLAWATAASSPQKTA